MEKTITAANFEAEVLQSDKPVLVDFWAEWCGPCKMVGPLVAEIAEEHPEIVVGKVNVDNEMALAQQYRIAAIPTLKVFYKGQCTATAVGYQDKEQLLELLASAK